MIREDYASGHAISKNNLFEFISAQPLDVVVLQTPSGQAELFNSAIAVHHLPIACPHHESSTGSSASCCPCGTQYCFLFIYVQRAQVKKSSVETSLFARSAIFTFLALNPVHWLTHSLSPVTRLQHLLSIELRTRVHGWSRLASPLS